MRQTMSQKQVVTKQISEEREFRAAEGMLIQTRVHFPSLYVTLNFPSLDGRG